MYAKHQKFIDYIATYDNGGMEIRSLVSQKFWAKNLTCPVIRVDGTLDLCINVKNLTKHFLGIVLNKQ